MRQVLFVDPGAIVGNAQVDMARYAGHLDVDTARCVAYSILDQVAYDLTPPVDIDPGNCRFCRGRDTQLHVASRGGWHEALDSPLGCSAYIGWMQVQVESSRVQPSQVEQIVDEAVQASRLAQNDPTGSTGIIDCPVAESLGISLDGCHWSPQIVGHGQQKLALQTTRPLKALSHGVHGPGQLGRFIPVARRRIRQACIKVAGCDSAGRLRSLDKWPRQASTKPHRNKCRPDQGHCCGK